MQYVGEESEGKIPVTHAANYWRGMNASSILEPIVHEDKLYPYYKRRENLFINVKKTQ